MTRQTTTSDVGYAIRDALDLLTSVELVGEGMDETDVIMNTDAADPDNLVLHLASGAQFTIRIVRTG